MSTGEVAKFMNNILFWPKALLVVPSGKMLKATNKFYIASIFFQFIIIFVAVNAFRHFANAMTLSTVVRIVLVIYIMISCIILNVIKIFLQLYASHYQEIFASLLEIHSRMKCINPFFPLVYNTFETKIFEALWTLLFLHGTFTGSTSYIYGNLRFWRLSTFLHNININMAHFVLTFIECFVNIINIQLDYIKKNINTKQKLFALEQCVEIYLKIYKTCIKIEKLFSPHLLSIMSLYFVTLIMHLHFLIMKSSEKHYRIKPLQNEYNLAMTVLCAVDILLCARSFQILHSNVSIFNRV